MLIYELYGRVAEQHAVECANHRRTIEVLADLQSGRLRPNQVEVDPIAATWKTFPERKPPEPEHKPRIQISEPIPELDLIGLNGSQE